MDPDRSKEEITTVREIRIKQQTMTARTNIWDEVRQYRDKIFSIRFSPPEWENKTGTQRNWIPRGVEKKYVKRTITYLIRRWIPHHAYAQTVTLSECRFLLEVMYMWLDEYLVQHRTLWPYKEEFILRSTYLTSLVINTTEPWTFQPVQAIWFHTGSEGHNHIST